MSQPQAILDYASPARAGRFRVGSHSVIDIFDRGEKVQILERLENRWVAALLIAIDLFIVSTLFFSVSWNRVRRDWYHGHQLDGSLVIACGFSVVFLVVAFIAILHNWASTRIDADAQELKIVFANPVRRRVFALNRITIHSLEVETAGGRNELRIFSSHHEIRLFTGHSLAELARIATLLVRALGLGEKLAESVPYATVAPVTSRGQ